jgi:YegS/Rv2252/BmrU family lipid kinase
VSVRPRVAVVINPVAGVGATLERARRRAELARDTIAAEHAEPDILITECSGHATELARSAVERGAQIVVAWGGDGTVNEVASALVGTAASLGIIPAGSGNGLARMLAMPADGARALNRIVHGADRRIDAGQIEDKLFFNVAGIGFDATIAAAFAAMGPARRGFLKYAAIVGRELRRYECGTYELTLEPAQPSTRHRAFLLTFANGRQWGNGAVIAPDAVLDDGALDVVVVNDQGRPAVLAAIPRLFLGRIRGVAGVSIRRTQAATVTGTGPLVYHADGDPHVSGPTVNVRVLPGVLNVRA